MSGFLGTRASLMLDLVVLAMVVVVPVLGWSVYLVRVKRNYLWHRRIQTTLGVTLAVAVAAFEVEMRWHGWVHLAQPSPYYQSGLVGWILALHLLVAVATTVLWVLVLVRAWRHFPNPPAPGTHSRWHRRWAWAATWGMVLTAVTGWVFYYVAFVA